MNAKTIEAVYFVECSGSSLEFDPIAIRPTFEKGCVMWEDKGPGTVVNTKKTNGEVENIANKKPEKIEIETEEGQWLTLTKMTLELFNRNVRDLAAGQPKFHSDSEVQAYYLNTNFDYYGS